MTDYPIQPVNFTQVHLADSFWSPKLSINREVSIPTAFHQCEINGRLDNFALAAGLKTGEHQGDFPFDDTDIYKVVEGASYVLAVQYDPQLDHYLDSVIHLIAAAQEPDGYLYTCRTNRCDRLQRWMAAVAGRKSIATNFTTADIYTKPPRLIIMLPVNVIYLTSR